MATFGLLCGFLLSSGTGKRETIKALNLLMR